MIFSKAKHAVCGVFLWVGMLTGFSVDIHAQTRIKFSSTEDVAIAFYKTGKVVPNFESWIKAQPPYNATPWAKREMMMEQEKTRLQLAYKNFDPEEDFLVIRTYASVNPQEKVDEKGEKTHSLSMAFTEAPEALYFPYDFMEQRIVVVPHKIDVIMNSDISLSQYEMIKEAVRTSSTNTLIVRLKPMKADLSRPYKIDGMDQWALTAEVVSMEVWSEQERLLWEYTVPWYVSPNTKKLNNLFKDRPTSSREIGAVKPLFK